MEVHCDLEVDVNGEESFIVDKVILYLQVVATSFLFLLSKW